MKYIKLNNSNLEVSRLCLGCMSFGEAEIGQYQWTLPFEKSKSIIEKAYEYGINFFDTSNNYSDGTSEQFLGKVIKQYNRKDIVITTKCYFNEGKLSPEAIHREISKSLNNLDTDYIDILVLHRFDYDTPVIETLKALNKEVQDGRIHHYGVSAMYAYQLAEYCYLIKENNFKPLVTLQNHYSPIYREDERDLIPLARQFNISQTSFAPFAAGRLTRHSWSSDSLRYQFDNKEGTRYDATEQYDKKINDKIYELSKKYNCSMANICLSWQFYKGVASPIVGITKQEYLDDMINCFDLNIDENDFKEIDDLYYPHKINCNR